MESPKENFNLSFISKMGRTEVKDRAAQKNNFIDRISAVERGRYKYLKFELKKMTEKLLYRKRLPYRYNIPDICQCL